MAIEKAQRKMVGKSEQVFLKLTVNRFFHRNDEQSSCPKTKSILRPGSDAMFDKLTVQNKYANQLDFYSHKYAQTYTFYALHWMGSIFIFALLTAGIQMCVNFTSVSAR